MEHDGYHQCVAKMRRYDYQVFSVYLVSYILSTYVSHGIRTFLLHAKYLRHLFLLNLHFLHTTDSAFT